MNLVHIQTRSSFRCADLPRALKNYSHQKNIRTHSPLSIKIQISFCFSIKIQISTGFPVQILAMSLWYIHDSSLVSDDPLSFFKQSNLNRIRTQAQSLSLSRATL